MRRLAVALLAAPAAALASVDNVPHVTPRDLAMAEATVAAQVGSPAAYVNPAALARIEGFDVSLAGGLLQVTDTWNTTTGLYPSPYTSENTVPPPAAYAAFGGKVGERGVGVGLGFLIPYGGAVDWPPGWTGRFEVETVDRRTYALYLSAGADVTRWLRLGAGLVYYRTTEQLSQAQAIPGGEGRVEVGTAGDSVTWDVAAEVGPFEGVPLTLGVNYRYKSAQTLEGDAHFTIPPALQTAFPDQKVTHEYTVPSRLDLGLAWRIRPSLQLVSGYTLDGYDVYASDTFVGTAIDPTTGRPLTVSVPRHYGNGYTLRLGGEWQAAPQLALRAGILRDHSGYQPDYYHPSIPDGHSWAAAVGAGWAVSKAISIDACFFYAWFDQVTATAQAALPGTYDIDAWIASLGITWRWTPGK
ncbi:MAG TPA: outer membrane protein transport protein [Anaeromyxobacteraceae bacterium]|nr:outer membrane protein transport protein [Anaeromyxobacteraceae bacterium]